MSFKSIRDLFTKASIPPQTIREIANSSDSERVDTAQENLGFTARLPGDQVEDHPLIQSQLGNPFYGINPLKVSRLLREGKLSVDLERQARVWLDQYQRLSGDVVYDRRNHEFEEPEINGDGGQCGIRRADPWPY